MYARKQTTPHYRNVYGHNTKWHIVETNLAGVLFTTLCSRKLRAVHDIIQERDTEPPDKFVCTTCRLIHSQRATI